MIFAIVFAMIAGPALGNDFQPMAVGHQWAYRISQSNEFRVGGQVVGREAKAGRYTRDVVREGRRKDVPVPLFVIDDVRTWRGGAEPDRVSTLAADRGGALLEYAMDLGEGLSIHTEPLVYLPARIKGGLSWHVGEVEIGTMTLTLEGEVLGLQDARTPMRTFERCLKVRYTGPVKGLVELPEGRLPIRSGRLDVVQWFAPGVGVVLAEETVVLDVLTTQGVMTATTTDKYSLADYKVGSVPARQAR